MDQARKDRKTRQITIGGAKVGGDAPVVVQSMCATRTIDVDQTVAQAHQLAKAGAGIVRIAMDSEKEIPALKEIRAQTKGIVLSVDLQENYKIAGRVAPHVDKIRYNPGHLHHMEKSKTIEQKVKSIVDAARDNNLAIRIGVNCGSVAPAFVDKYPGDQLAAIVESAAYHCELMDELGFTRFVVSLKDSDPNKVMDANRRFSKRRPDVPIHLGVTEAGLPPDGIIKTRIAFEKLLAQGIGDTIRVSLTLPNERKHEEVIVGHKIIEDVAAGRFISVPDFGTGLNIISCPSCSRVENMKFVELAQQVKELTTYAQKYKITIAVMGCRVNGPGETDDADLGLWCGPTTVNLKKKDRKIGYFGYDEVLPKLRAELDRLIAERTAAAN
ncbi:(E)-4-hydroxy-3-methylbut-2-enyl-diphosphate synthase [Candidatus Binatus soli]|jgi:(E)-4-hydroxy-3-methylbut-2-enyl-diphosphate synthase|uniref:(E)-4-hydroxy-3-methylbut-2-enyl-diphosphate synthase n=1 Tax=Candidatus Binatus soli TaxID=1953413 RepID=UPI003D0CAC56